MAIIILVKLLAAHMVGDFILQSKRSLEHQVEHRVLSYQLYIHVIIHGMLALIIINDFNFWLYAVIISSSHLTIDLLKLYFIGESRSNKVMWFLADQILHLIVIVIIWKAYCHIDFTNILSISDKYVIIITGGIIITKPIGILIRELISLFKHNPEDALPGAGMWIGILERMLIYGFIIVGQWEGIGFLLAAKTVFRFGDLTNTNDQAKAEYILIGTLLSFTLAIGTGLLCTYLFSFV
jgi:hypothetical protein